MKSCDVAIIGAGSAGLSARREVARETDDYVVIDDGPLGTTCARVGCMPSKVLIQAAEDFGRREHFDQLGIRGGEGLSLDSRQTMNHVRQLRDRFVGGVMKGMEEWRDTHLMRGRARFVDGNTLDVDGERIRAGRVVIATGSRPVIPGAWEAHREYFLDSDNIFEQEVLPERLGVVGLGVIGLELGQALHNLGVGVTAYTLDKRFGGLSDPELQEYAAGYFSSRFPVKFKGVDRLERSDTGLVVHAGDEATEVDRLLLAMGRRPNVDDMGLENIGVELDDKGMPPFERDTLRIPDTSVFIAGDVTGDHPVLHEAADEGRIVGYNAVQSSDHCFRRRQGLTITFSSPNIAIVGRSHESLVRDGAAFETGKVSYEGQGRALVMLENKGLLHVYGDRETGRLLGAEIMAPRGEHMAHLLSWSLAAGITAHQALSMPFYHPVVEEGLRTALRDLAKKVEGKRTPLELMRCEDPPIGG
ncbi:MAG: dihydrolipoyl dehydrogenase [Gammaproteobacteria bacterium]|nr:dihydrolipoyl dehydrogenase [Gammaproteobacteria bacterium]